MKKILYWLLPAICLFVALQPLKAKASDDVLVFPTNQYVKGSYSSGTAYVGRMHYTFEISINDTLPLDVIYIQNFPNAKLNSISFIDSTLQTSGFNYSALSKFDINVFHSYGVTIDLSDLQLVDIQSIQFIYITDPYPTSLWDQRMDSNLFVSTSTFWNGFNATAWQIAYDTGKADGIDSVDTSKIAEDNYNLGKSDGILQGDSEGYARAILNEFERVEGEQSLLTFAGALLGAIGSFIMFLLLDISIFGINGALVISVIAGFVAVIFFIKLVF